ncbi:hypothetical protein FAZ19_21485 [Sphingobacterium alkalisoli]|uniref:Tetratricopeptide repeat protein n=1 Tax=Sphingobacterium alkalisoli TaxID=1874115 RepID=A0A4U0GSN3_9SPHI|nr:hypothetical protein [Sphingobacterium alkalisoli]TJY61474.1 hypothetical protein FAZ19_21485 [Sphingobacterium alkalisoli]GGH30166.1 hypothetical protein GCM10011418_42010 [Sphingobacterium alkalisoli]
MLVGSRCFFITLVLFFTLQLPCFGENNHIDPVLDQYTQFRQYVGKDSLALLAGLSRLWEKAKRDDSNDLRAVYYVLLGEGQTRLQKRDNPTSRRAFNKAIEWAKRSNRTEMLLWVTQHVAYSYYRSRTIAEALPYFVESKRFLLKVPEERVIDKVGTFKRMGYISGTIGQHKESLDYLFKALSYVGNDRYEKAEILDNIGVLMLERQDTIAAKKYFIEAREMARMGNDAVRYAKVLGNLSRISAANGNAVEAIRYLKEDITISKKHDNQQNTLFASLALAELYVKKDSLNRAELILDEIANILDRNDQLVTFAQRYVKIKLDISLKNHDIISEMKFRRLLDTLERKANDWDGNNVISSSRNLIEKQMLFEQDRIKMEEQEGPESRKMFYSGLTWSIVIVLIGSTVAISLVVRNQNNRKEDLPQIHAPAVDIGKGTADRLSEMLDSHLMTDDKWKEFKEIFEEEYAEFCARLTTDFEEVNETHLRYIALFKLGLNKRQIGEVLGVTESAVKKTRQRLRKKMSNEKFEQLEKLITSS